MGHSHAGGLRARGPARRGAAGAGGRIGGARASPARRHGPHADRRRRAQPPRGRAARQRPPGSVPLPPLSQLYTSRPQEPSSPLSLSPFSLSPLSLSYVCPWQVEAQRGALDEADRAITQRRIETAALHRQVWSATPPSSCSSAHYSPPRACPRCCVFVGVGSYPVARPPRPSPPSPRPRRRQRHTLTTPRPRGPAPGPGLGLGA
jgi:hypothetical protein